MHRKIMPPFQPKALPWAKVYNPFGVFWMIISKPECPKGINISTIRGIFDDYIKSLMPERHQYTSPWHRLGP